MLEWRLGARMLEMRACSDSNAAARGLALVSPVGLEPTTERLRVSCSAAELRARGHHSAAVVAVRARVREDERQDDRTVIAGGAMSLSCATW